MMLLLYFTAYVLAFVPIVQRNIDEGQTTVPVCKSGYLAATEEVRFRICVCSIAAFLVISQVEALREGGREKYKIVIISGKI